MSNPTPATPEEYIIGGTPECPGHGARCIGANCCCADLHPSPTPVGDMSTKAHSIDTDSPSVDDVSIGSSNDEMFAHRTRLRQVYEFVLSLRNTRSDSTDEVYRTCQAILEYIGDIARGTWQVVDLAAELQMVRDRLAAAEREMELERKRSEGLFVCLKQANDDIRLWGGTDDLDNATLAVQEKLEELESLRTQLSATQEDSKQRQRELVAADEIARAYDNGMIEDGLWATIDAYKEIRVPTSQEPR